MLSREERTAILAEANRRRHERKRRAVEDALRAMLKGKSKVSVAGVAVTAGVSRNFIYGQKDLFDEIREAAEGQPHRLHRPRPAPSTEASLRARLVTALDALGEAKTRIGELEATVERLTAELARHMTAEPGR